MTDHIRLDEVLTDAEIETVYWVDPGRSFIHRVRACIRLAVEKWPEKVEGCTRMDGTIFGPHPGLHGIGRSECRHALLLLGPKYEPRPITWICRGCERELAVSNNFCWFCGTSKVKEPTAGGLVTCPIRILRGDE